SFPGPEAPKLSIEIILPSLPTYLCQPKGLPASTANLLLTFFGSTSSLYSSVCNSNISQDGILTTLTPYPFSSNLSAASYTNCNSEPVPIKITSSLDLSSLTTYPPFSAPFPVPSNNGKSCLVKARPVGPSSLVKAVYHPAAVSLASAGLKIVKLGIALNIANCSIG